MAQTFELQEQKNVARRRFLNLMGWFALLVSGLMWAGSSIRYLFPNVLYEPPTSFKVGRPDRFPSGTALFIEEKKIFVFRNEDKYHVISAVCTHLGCTVNFAQTGFNCPCHGSRFNLNGNVLSGPAPRPLEWFAMSMAADGQLVVDTARIVEPGYSFKV